MFESLRGGPWAVRRLRDEMDRLFANMFEGHWHPELSGRVASGGYPALNVWETEGALLAEVEVPGVQLHELELQVTGNELTIRGERKDGDGKDTLHHRRERPIGAFERTIRVPTGVDGAKVEAALRDGVLTVTLPKAEASKPRKIAIRSGK